MLILIISFKDKLDQRMLLPLKVRIEYYFYFLKYFYNLECVQSLHAIQSKDLLSLSIQQILDCCPQPIEDPFKCLSSTVGGLCLSQDYPKDGQCNKTVCKPAALVC
jgi:hypothetical protein